MAARKTPIHSRREYFTFGDGFPGFGETDERKASRWNADLFEDAPVSEPENAPVAYTGDDDFPTRGRYSGVGVIVDETGEFDPEPARCESAKVAAVCGSPAQAAPARCSAPIAFARSTEPIESVNSSKQVGAADNSEPAAHACNPGPAASTNKSKPAASVEAKLDLSLFRELYRSRDGRLVFFEHRVTGHLAAVDASKLV